MFPLANIGQGYQQMANRGMSPPGYGSVTQPITQPVMPQIPQPGSPTTMPIANQGQQMGINPEMLQKMALMRSFGGGSQNMAPQYSLAGGVNNAVSPLAGAMMANRLGLWK